MESDRSKWLRPPALHSCGHRGDRTYWMWVAEPEAHKGIWGFSYTIGESDRARGRDADLHEEARLKFEDRLKGPPTTYTEGSAFHIFEERP